MNYNTKDRRHSSQRKEGKWTSKQCPRVMLPEMYKQRSVPKDKHLKVKEKAALFLFTVSLQGFSRPQTQTFAALKHEQDREERQRVRTGMMLNLSNLHITSPDFPASQLLVG